MNRDQLAGGNDHLVADDVEESRHAHAVGYPLRRFVGRSGVWVRRHGEWTRPLSVWLYRGAWRVTCFVCLTSIRSDESLLDGGWPSVSSAFAVAMVHCSGCPVAREPS